MSCRYVYGDGEETRSHLSDRIDQMEVVLVRIENLLKLMAPPKPPTHMGGMRVYDGEGNLIR